MDNTKIILEAYEEAICHLAESNLFEKAPTGSQSKGKDIVHFVEGPKVVDTLEKYRSKVANIDSVYKDFKSWKTDNPFVPFGSAANDAPLKGGDLSEVGLWHLKVGRDVRLYYKPTRVKGQPVILVIGFFTHDETGTGTPPKQRIQKTFAKSAEGLSKKMLGEETSESMEAYTKFLDK